MIEWTPEYIAKIAMLVMAVPVAITMIVLVSSILIKQFAKKAGIMADASKAEAIDRFTGNLFYAAFLSVSVMQLSILVLMLCGVWAVALWLIDLF